MHAKPDSRIGSSGTGGIVDDFIDGDCQEEGLTGRCATVGEAADEAVLEVHGGGSVGVGEERGAACVCIVVGGVGGRENIRGNVHGIEGRYGACEKEEKQSKTMNSGG